MSSWPEETPLFWQQVTEIARNNPITEYFKTDYIVRRVPLYSHKMTSYLLLQMQEIFDYIDQQDSTTATRLKLALQERKHGHDEKSYELFTFAPRVDIPNVSAWTIKCFHHALTLEKLSRKKVTEYKHIMEVGAGAGELCRILFDAFQYKGKYTVVDLPEIMKYADYNLVNYPVKFEQDIKKAVVQDEPTLLIGTWSLSEMGLSERKVIFDHCKDCDLFVAFQGMIFGEDNRAFFVKDYPTSYKKSIRLEHIPMHLADNGNFYMFAE
jgi:hypothetical protein